MFFKNVSGSTCVVGMKLGESGNVSGFHFGLNDSQVSVDGEVLEVLVVVGFGGVEGHLDRQLDLLGLGHPGIDIAAGTRFRGE